MNDLDWSKCATAIVTRGLHRVCARDVGHSGDHRDVWGTGWERPEVTLERLRARWGFAFRFSFTGSAWVALNLNRHASRPTEVEMTPERLEDRLRELTPPAQGLIPPSIGAD